MNVDFLVRVRDRSGRITIDESRAHLNASRGDGSAGRRLDSETSYTASEIVLHIIVTVLVVVLVEKVFRALRCSEVAVRVLVHMLVVVLVLLDNIEILLLKVDILIVVMLVAMAMLVEEILGTLRLAQVVVCILVHMLVRVLVLSGHIEILLAKLDIIVVMLVSVVVLVEKSLGAPCLAQVLVRVLVHMFVRVLVLAHYIKPLGGYHIEHLGTCLAKERILGH